MAGERVQRRLAAIAVADVVGYIRLMEADEAGTLAALKQRRKTILEPMVRDHGGRIVKVMGDGVLIEFASAVNAVDAALELQAKMAEANRPVAEDRHIVLRIGINLGDVIGDGSDIYGDGVNIAARLEALAEPGASAFRPRCMRKCVARSNWLRQIWARATQEIARPVRVYRGRSGSTGSWRRRPAPARQPQSRRSPSCPSTISAAIRPAISFRRHHRGHHHRAVALQRR